MPISPVLIFVVIVVLYLISSVKILAEYERGVIFRLGKLLPQPKGPGVILVFAPIDRIVRVSLRTVAFEVPATVQVGVASVVALGLGTGAAVVAAALGEVVVEAGAPPQAASRKAAVARAAAMPGRSETMGASTACVPPTLHAGLAPRA